MAKTERDVEHLDENSPEHMAQMMEEVKDLMPAGTMPKEPHVAIKRLAAGKDPENIKTEMRDMFDDFEVGLTTAAVPPPALTTALVAPRRRRRPPHQSGTSLF